MATGLIGPVLDTPEKQARAAQRQDADDLVNKADVAYRGQLAFAVAYVQQGDDFKGESLAVRAAITKALQKLERTLTLCGVQPVIQFHAKALERQAETLGRREAVIEMLEKETEP